MRVLFVALVPVLLVSLTESARAQEIRPSGEPRPEDDSATASATLAPAAPDPDEEDRGWLSGRSGRLARPVLPPPVRERRPDAPRVWFYWMDGGPFYRQLYGVSMYGGEGSLGADLELTHLAITMGGTFSYGWLEPGLNVTQFQVDGAVMAKEGILRVGAGLGLGFLSISSVTADPSALGLVIDLSALVTLDLVRFSEDGNRAMYLGAKFRATLVVASDAQPVAWGPVGVLGFRL